MTREALPPRADWAASLFPTAPALVSVPSASQVSLEAPATPLAIASRARSQVVHTRAAYAAARRTLSAYMTTCAHRLTALDSTVQLLVSLQSAAADTHTKLQASRRGVADELPACRTALAWLDAFPASRAALHEGGLAARISILEREEDRLRRLSDAVTEAARCIAAVRFGLNEATLVLHACVEHWSGEEAEEPGNDD